MIQLRHLIRGQSLTLSDFQSCSRAFFRHLNSGSSFPRCEGQEIDPKLSSLAPTMRIQGEKVTRSCLTKENLSIHCQTKEFQILQTGELLRPYQQHPAPPQASASGQVMEAMGLVLLQV